MALPTSIDTGSQEITIQTNPCLVCHKTSELKLDVMKLNRWRTGELVQNVWPEWSPGQAELLVTGTHDACWDVMFGEGE